MIVRSLWAMMSILVEQEDVAPLLELEQAARERQQLPLAGREVLA
jgi:hypothetical protein